MVPSPRHVLLLEDDANDAVLIGRAVRDIYPEAEVELIINREQLLSRLDAGPVDVVLSDSTVPGCEGLKGFHLARNRHPHVPFVYVSGSPDQDRDLAGLRALGATAFLSKSDLTRLGPAIETALVERDRTRRSLGLMAGYEYLVQVIAELSRAHDMSAIMRVVRQAARELTGADGSTFILRDGDTCLYADEDSVDPLWLGQRFPIDECLSGWAISHRQPAVVFDINQDPRVKASDYTGTFVRGIVIVPIRALDPVGAIGAYWSEPREPYPQEVRLLQALADSTAVAIENAGIYQDLEARVREQASELEAFTHAVSHGLQAPIRHVKSFAQVLVDEHRAKIDDNMKRTVDRILRSSVRMETMLDGLASLSRASRFAVQRQVVDLAMIAREVADECQQAAARPADFNCPATLNALCDPALMRHVLQNLLENAWKFSSIEDRPRIEIGMHAGRPDVYYVRDNGIGFDDTAAESIFDVFHRLSTSEEFPGSGIGLSIAERIVHKHGGRIWAKSRPGAGATFYFTLESTGLNE
jgi:signal transduction histidine kinase